MSDSLPTTSGQLEDPQAEIARLNKIIQALMNRAERNASLQGSDFNLFQTAITLEDEVRSRTGELEVASLEKARISRDLRESENHYRLLVENSPMSIHEIDRDGRITSMSQAGLRMRGINTESEILDTLYLNQVCAADRKQIAELFAMACAGETCHFEFKASGARRQILKSCFVPIKNKYGSVEKLMGLTEDITERKFIEQQLMEREALFRAIFDQASIGIELIDPDTLKFIEANPAACRMMGYTHEEFLHLRLVDIHVGVDEKAVLANMQQAEVAGGVIYESRHRCKNGNILDVEINARILDLPGKRLLVGIWRDITEYKRAQEEIAFKNTILQTQQEVSPDAILVVDENRKIISYNQQFIEMWQLTQQMVSARLDAPVLQAVADQVENQKIFGERVNYLYQHHGEMSFEEVKLKDGRILDRYSAPLNGADGKYHGRVWYFRDITKRKKAEEQVRNLAFYDTLTQLANRRLLNDRLGQAMSASKRSGRYGAVMFMDLDNFKPLNDTHGHDMGDLLLIEVANRITRCVREIDTVARFGGDEFVVMLSELDEDKELSQTQAGIVAEKIRVMVAEPYLLTRKLNGNTENTVVHHCTASIGVVLFINHKFSPEDVLKWSDIAMYQAKDDGRNTVHFLDTSQPLPD